MQQTLLNCIMESISTGIIIPYVSKDGEQVTVIENIFPVQIIKE
jgi:hypothetical protein